MKRIIVIALFAIYSICNAMEKDHDPLTTTIYDSDDDIELKVGNFAKTTDECPYINLASKAIKITKYCKGSDILSDTKIARNPAVLKYLTVTELPVSSSDRYYYGKCEGLGYFFHESWLKAFDPEEDYHKKQVDGRTKEFKEWMKDYLKDKKNE